MLLQEILQAQPFHWAAALLIVSSPSPVTACDSMQSKGILAHRCDKCLLCMLARWPNRFSRHSLV